MGLEVLEDGFRGFMLLARLRRGGSHRSSRRGRPAQRPDRERRAAQRQQRHVDVHDAPQQPLVAADVLAQGAGRVLLRLQAGSQQRGQTKRGGWYCLAAANGQRPAPGVHRQGWGRGLGIAECDSRW